MKSVPALRFGKGKQNLLILTGGLDVLHPILWRWASPHYFSYLTQHFTLYVFGLHTLSQNDSTLDIATRYIDILNVVPTPISLMGFYGGAYIAQHLAHLRPKAIKKLILVSASAKTEAKTQKILIEWQRQIQQEKWRKVYVNMTKKWMGKRNIFTFFPTKKPKKLNDFVLYLQACAYHDATATLNQIKCPTLVMGGDQDLFTEESNIINLAKNITNAECDIIKGGCHSFYINHRAFFQSQSLRFLLR